MYKNVKLMMHGVAIIKAIKVHRLGTVCVSVQKHNGGPD